MAWPRSTSVNAVAMREMLIETIRLAVAAGASTEAEPASAQACRTALNALDALPGQSMAMVPPLRQNSLAGVDLDQILELLIGKVRTSAPPHSASSKGASPPALRIPIVHVRR